MIWLGMDTSTPSCSVALFNGAEPISEVFMGGNQTHATHLVQLIDQVLAMGRVDVADITGIALTLGPGSFTGLRIGLSTAKGLCLAHGLKMVGVSTLDAIAWRHRFSNMPVCVMVDARKGEVYTATYQFKAGSLFHKTEEIVCGPGVVVGHITEPTIFCGTGARVYQSEISERCSTGAIFPDNAGHAVAASMVISAAYEAIVSGNTIEPATVSPVYIRPSDAEIHMPS